MSASRSSAVWWDYRRGPFPCPLTIYAAKVESVSGWGPIVHCWRAAFRQHDLGVQDSSPRYGDYYAHVDCWTVARFSFLIRLSAILGSAIGRI
jgi:hypothetical protein